MKGKIVGIIVAILGVTIIGAAVQAAPQRFDTGDTTTLAKDQVVDSAYYAFAKNVTISGGVKGDVYCGGETVTIDGIVDGDVYCAGQNVKINGLVTGDVRVAGQQVNLGGSVGGNATLLGQNVSVEKTAKIGRDLNGAGQLVDISGVIERDVTLGADTMTVDGTVGRNITSDVTTLKISNGAQVKGSLYYTSAQAGQIAEGTVVGETKRSEPSQGERDYDEQSLLTFLVYLFFALLIMGVALVLFMPQVIHAVSENGMNRLGMSILVGFFTVFGMPIVVVAIAVTVVGLPLAGVILLGWLLILALSTPMFGYYLGRLIMRSATSHPFVFMVMGLTVLLLSYIVPFVNMIMLLAAAVIGSGMTVLELAKRYKKPSYTVKVKK